MGVSLNNAIAAMAIGAFLRRLRKQGRDPDCWEADQAIRAMALLACDQYQQAIDQISKALIPPSKRDPVTVAGVEKAMDKGVVPSLVVLQSILEEICNAGDAFTCLI